MLRVLIRISVLCLLLAVSAVAQKTDFQHDLKNYPGSNTQVIFNDGGALVGSPNFTFDRTLSRVTVGPPSSAQGFVDLQGAAGNPGNPASGWCRQYYNTTTGYVEWRTSLGASCGPAPGTSMVYPGAGVGVSTGSAWTSSIPVANFEYVANKNANGGYVGRDSSGNAAVPGTFTAGTGTGQGYIDTLGGASSPGNPAASNCRGYFNTTTGMMTWISSTGASCGPTSSIPYPGAGLVTSTGSDWGTPISESDGYVVYGSGGAWGKSNAPAISAANMISFPALPYLSSSTVLPATPSVPTNNFLNAYNATTGAFGYARPTWANIDKTTSSIADLATRTCATLSDAGSGCSTTVGTAATHAATDFAAYNASTTVAGQACALGSTCSIASTNLSDSSGLERTASKDTNGGYVGRSAGGNASVPGTFTAGTASGATGYVDWQGGAAPANPVSGWCRGYYNGTVMQWLNSAGTSCGPTSSIPYPSAGIAVSTGSAWGSSLSAPTGSLVGTGQANSYTTGLQDFSSATMKLPASVNVGANSITLPGSAGTLALTSQLPTGMTWPAAGGIAVYGGSSSWGTSLIKYGMQTGVATAADPGATANVPMVSDGSHGTQPHASGALGTAAFTAATAYDASGAAAARAAPGSCISGQYGTATTTSGLTCAQVAYSQVSGTPSTSTTVNGQTCTLGSTCTISAGVAGSDKQVQFNDGGSLAGDSGLTYNKTSKQLTVGATSSAQGYIDSQGAAGAPANPTAGWCRQYFNTTTGATEWHTSTGAWCGPTAAAVGALASSTVLPATPSVSAHYFLNSYSATTGAFGSARPACGDLSDSGSLCASSATVPTSSSWPGAGTCTAGQYMTAIANGTTPTCAQVTYSQVGSTPTLAQTISAVSHKFLTAYSSSTGVFTAGQPACGDLSDAGAGCSSGAPPSAYASTPAMDGTGSAGSSANYARGDHVHPTDTSLVPKGSATWPSSGTVAITSNIPSASTTTPAMDGSASYGSGTTWARSDHVHPTDTSRAASGASTSVNGSACALGSSCTVTASLPSTPTECPAGQAARGVDSSGNARDCFTPSGSAPTTVIKRGTGSGTDYDVSSSSYVNVDGTNLSYTTTIPSGSILKVTAVFTSAPNGGSASWYALADGGTVLQEIRDSLEGATSSATLVYVITGNGASHTVTLQAKVEGGGHAYTWNRSSTMTPMMIFELLASN